MTWMFQTAAESGGVTDCDAPVQEDRPSDAADERVRLSAVDRRRLAEARRLMYSPDTQRALTDTARWASGPASQIGQQVAASVSRTTGISRAARALYQGPAYISAVHAMLDNPGFMELSTRLLEISGAMPDYRRLPNRLAPAVDMANFTALFRRYQPENWHAKVDGEEATIDDLIDLARDRWSATRAPGPATLAPIRPALSKFHQAVVFRPCSTGTPLVMPSAKSSTPI